MKRIPFDEVLLEFTRVLLGLGFEDSAAKRCAQIFTENTCDGVVSHFYVAEQDVYSRVIEELDLFVRTLPAGVGFVFHDED